MTEQTDTRREAGAFDNLAQAHFNSFAKVALQAWSLGAEGKINEALAAYREVDSMVPPELTIAPLLSLLRHARGDVGEGRPIPTPPNEMQVVTVGLNNMTMEAPDAQGLSPLEVDADSLLENILNFILSYKPGYHKANITKELPHIMVMSAGRSGTISLYHLFERSRLVPYHTYWWKVANDVNFEMMCRLVTGNFDTYRAPHHWAQTRAAEWLGCVHEDRAMVALNHLDTIYAPAFAAIHPQSKFVYLHRNPQDIFVSFFNKGQWSNQQLCPLNYTFAPKFAWRASRFDIITQLAWYIRFTETFCRAMGKVMGDRFIEISADKLFEQSPSEIDKLIGFTGADLDHLNSVKHFSRKYNEKVHKQEVSMNMMARPIEAFLRAYEEEG